MHHCIFFHWAWGWQLDRHQKTLYLKGYTIIWSFVSVDSRFFFEKPKQCSHLGDLRPFFCPPNRPHKKLDFVNLFVDNRPGGKHATHQSTAALCLFSWHWAAKWKEPSVELAWDYQAPARRSIPTDPSPMVFCIFWIGNPVRHCHQDVVWIPNIKSHDSDSDWSVLPTFCGLTESFLRQNNIWFFICSTK